HSRGEGGDHFVVDGGVRTAVGACRCDALDGRGEGNLVAVEALGLGDVGRAGRGEEVVELVEATGVEHARSLGDALDLLDEAVALDAVGGILQGVLGVHDHEPGPAAGTLPDRKSTRLNSSHLGISY